MNDLCWTKTLLGVYRYLEKISDAIDKIVLKSAINSSNILGYNYHKNNVLSISQKIIDLSERKVTLINLKVLIECVLQKISDKDAVLLIEKYIDNTKIRVLAEKYNVSIRTIFRKINSAELEFSRKLASAGYNQFRLKEELRNESWIMNYYHQVKNKGEDLDKVASL